MSETKVVYVSKCCKASYRHEQIKKGSETWNMVKCQNCGKECTLKIKK